VRVADSSDDHQRTLHHRVVQRLCAEVVQVGGEGAGAGQGEHATPPRVEDHSRVHRGGLLRTRRKLDEDLQQLDLGAQQVRQQGGGQHLHRAQPHHARKQHVALRNRIPQTAGLRGGERLLGHHRPRTPLLDLLDDNHDFHVVFSDDLAALEPDPGGRLEFLLRHLHGLPLHHGHIHLVQPGLLGRGVQEEGHDPEQGHPELYPHLILHRPARQFPLGLAAQHAGHLIQRARDQLPAHRAADPADQDRETAQEELDREVALQVRDGHGHPQLLAQQHRFLRVVQTHCDPVPLRPLVLPDFHQL